MVSIVTKNIKGIEYLYLVESIRSKDRVVQKTVKYIGKKRPVTKEEFECMEFSYHNKDWVLNKTVDELSYTKHEELKKLSSEYKAYLKKLDLMSRQKQKERFLSAFIANSNAIEGSTMSVKDTFEYLFSDVSPEGFKKKELSMAKNMLSAWNYLEENYKRFPKIDDLKTLHKIVNSDIESESTLGKFKQVQNYVGHELTSSHLYVDEKIKKLFNWTKKAYLQINDFEVVFQSHAQFEIIHPFIDGNGRVGRLLMNWLLMNKGYLPLAIESRSRIKYISALNNARREMLLPMCEFCYSEYKNNYDKFI